MFKILLGEKQVLLNDSFNKFPDYKSLKEAIINASQAPAYKKSKASLKDKDKFILKLTPDSGIIGVEAIWNNETYQYFLEKIASKKNTKFRLFLERVDRFPEFKKKELIEIFKESIDNIWKPLEEEIKKELPLSKLEKSKGEYDQLRNKLYSNEYKNNEEHKNILCRNCCTKNFKGTRYICSECKNYNLCEECEKLLAIRQIHPRDHVFIKIKKPFTDEIKDNVIKYNCLFGNNNKVIQSDSPSFQFDFSIVNTGQNDLNDCYISPVRFGDEYMSCVPKVINTSLTRNNKTELSIVISTPREKEGIYDGYFRMFTPNGLPFGDILKVKGVIGE